MSFEIVIKLGKVFGYKNYLSYRSIKIKNKFCYRYKSFSYFLTILFFLKKHLQID